MSYKDYSKEAVKAIMQKTRESQQNNKTAGLPHSLGLSLNELNEIGLNSKEVEKALKKYDHPEIIKENRMSETHLLISKKFNSVFSEDVIWNKIQDELKHTYSDKFPEKVRIHSTQHKWYHLDHANHETIISIEKSSDTAKLNISQRLGFWSPHVEGMVHSTYISLLFSGLAFAILSPELPVIIAAFALLWSLQALMIYSFSIQERKRKLESMETFANQIIDRISSDNKRDL